MKLWSAGLASLLMMVACGGDDTSSSGLGGSPAGGQGGAGTGGLGGQAEGGAGGTGGAGGGGGPVAGCAAAPAMEEFSPKAYFALEALEARDDRDYFLLPVEADTWVSLFARHHPDASTPDDLVAQVYTADGSTLLASGDDPFPHLDTQNVAELHFHVPQDDVYCVEVMHELTWTGSSYPGGPDELYQIISNPTDGFYNFTADFDDEPNDSAAEAPPDIAPAGIIIASFGTLATADDVDYYSFDVDSELSVVFFQPTREPGPQLVGWGGTPPRITLVDDGGLPVAARNAADALATCDPDNFCWMLAPTTPGATYHLMVERASDDPFTPGEMYGFVRGGGDSVALPPEDPSDVTSGTNDTSATAEDAPQGPPTPVGPSFVFGGTLHDGDEDWWRIPAGTSGDELALYCHSQTIGSGVTAFTASSWSETNLGAPTPDQDQTETPTQPIAWGKVPHTAMASIDGETAQYLRLTSTTFDPMLSSRYYRCQVIRFEAGM